MNLFAQTKKIILDTLFPINCLSCHAEDVWLCEKCLQKIKLLPHQFCPQCKMVITDHGKVCDTCQKKSFALNGLIVACHYKENDIARIIHFFKYRFIKELSSPLGEIMTRALLQSDLPLPDIIVPIPLHPKRLRFRGFNQSELLARHISQNLIPNLTIPMRTDIIIRQKNTTPQMKIKNYLLRQKNVLGAFIFNPNLSPEEIKQKNILLIDDIATTGSTLNECAKALKKTGAKKIFGAVIAR